MEVRKLLMEELSRGATLFLNSHLLAETERVCGRVGILSAGRVLREGKVEDLCQSSAHYRVRFAPGCDAAALEAAGFVAGREGREAGAFRCEAETPEKLNEALDRARRSGALLVEVAKEEKDLEEVLQEVVRGAAPAPEVREEAA